MKPVRCESGDGVFAIGIEARDLGDRLDAPSNAAALDENHEVDRLGDQPPGYSDDGLLDQLFQAIERRPGGVGVNGGDAARVAGVPGFQHVEGLDRESVVSGKSVSLRVALGGGRIIKKKNPYEHTTPHY